MPPARGHATIQIGSKHMKIISIAGLGAALVLAACGGAAAPEPPSSAAPAAAITVAPATAKLATPAPAAPAQTAAAANPSPAAGPAKRVELTATNDTMSIQKLDLTPGQAVEFVVKHTGDEKHNLVAVGGPSLVSPDFDGGATITWNWTAPSRPGEFKLVCAYHPAITPITVTVK